MNGKRSRTFSAGTLKFDAMVTVATLPRIHSATIVTRRTLGPDAWTIELEAPTLTPLVAPGQFAMVLASERDALPFALGFFRVDGTRVEIFFESVGARTRALARRAAGDTLELLGPLGRGFVLEPFGDDAALVAEGVGLGPLGPVAEALRARGARVRIVYAARRPGERALLARYEELGCETRAIDAGDPAALAALYASFAGDARAVAMRAPAAYRDAVVVAAHARGRRVQVSLEATFACGVGVCHGCVVRVARDGAAPAFERVCTEGPVFWADELR